MFGCIGKFFNEWWYGIDYIADVEKIGVPSYVGKVALTVFVYDLGSKFIVWRDMDLVYRTGAIKVGDRIFVNSRELRSCYENKWVK